MGARRDTIKVSRVTYACFVGLVGMIVLYLYFLNMSVVQVVMRTEYIQQEQQLSAQISSLESKYIEAQHTIVAQVATLNEYTEQSEKFFISREQASLVLGN